MCQSHSTYHTMEESTQNRKCKDQVRKSKRVTFSEMSAMLCYDDGTTSETSDLHYSDSDYTRFKREAFDTARKLRTSIKTSTQDEATIQRYTKLWKRLPALLRDNEIDPQEMIGLEHLVIGKNMLHVNLSLRRSSVRLLLEEQYRQMELGYHDPRLLADTTMPISQISSSIAYSRANAVPTLEY